MKPFFRWCCLALAVTLVCPRPAEGQKGRTEVNEGNRLYSEGRFDEAHQRYLEALLDDPDSPLIRFNDGSALYRSEDFQQAMERFLKAAESEDPALRSAAWYNLGNALYRQEKLQESLEAYKEALRSNPADVDSKYNLERVLERLQQQEQQQQGQEGEEGDQDQQAQNQDQQNQGQEGQDQRKQEGEEPQEQEPPQAQGEQPSQEENPQEGTAEGQSQPGQMTPEEAERLLSAIREDPGEVNRRRAPATGKRPRKDW